MLPPPEKIPLVLLQWGRKALEIDNQRNDESVIRYVRSAIEKGGLILLPSKARDTLLITASQQALEYEAELDGLIKKRKINDEAIMDFFSTTKKELFRQHGKINRDTLGLFTLHERSYLVLKIFERITVDSHLFDILSPKNRPSAKYSGATNLRYLLQKYGWIEVITLLHADDQKEILQSTTWWPWYQLMPPVHQIQDYFGPAVAMYFGFLGFLNQWVAILGIVGTTFALFRIYRGDTVDEDEYTPFYGLICFIWSALFLRYWDRLENSFAYDWGTLTITRVASDDKYRANRTTNHWYHRPEFRGRTRISPVTGELELHFPSYKRKLRYVFSAIVTTWMLGLAFLIMILSLNLQGYIVSKENSFHPFHFPAFAVLSAEGALFDAKSDWMSLVPVVLHALCILTLNTFYRSVAKKLTDWENHFTQTGYDNSMILKRFLFEAFDCYVALFYLAFYERDVEWLRKELISVFYIDIARRIGTEVFLPTLLHLTDKNDEEHPHDLHLDIYESFDDYMEILISFGYVTLFASAYPFASMVMFFSVWVEIRSDCYKLCYLCQKPAGDLVSNIGMWKTVLAVLVLMSCLTNCFLFGFTSDQMMHYLPDLYIRDESGITHLVHDKGWLTILIIFGLERGLLCLGWILHHMIPAIPEALSIKLGRRRYLLTEEAKKSKSD